MVKAKVSNLEVNLYNYIEFIDTDHAFKDHMQKKYSEKIQGESKDRAEDNNDNK